MKHSNQYKISTLTGVSIVMANMIGTGAFTSLGFQLQQMQSLPVILTLWILGGILALAGAFSYAEVGTAIVKSGGEYAFLSELYHPLAGYLSGWISLTVGFSAPIALAAIAFTGYFRFGNFDPKWIAVLLMAAVTVIHTRNLKASSKFQLASTLFKIGVMVTVILSGLAISGQTGVSFHIGNDYFPELKSEAFAIALIYVTYSYSGWNAAAYISEEFKHPRKSLPLALVGGTLMVTILYTLLQFVFLKHAPVPELAGKVEVGEIAAARMFGPSAGKLFGIIISALLISSISAMVWVGPRVTSSMAAQHPLWEYFAVQPGKIPKRALWLQFLLGVILVLTGTFEQIMVYCGVLLTLSTMLVVFSVFRLRLKTGHRAGYRSPLFPVFQILYLLLSAWMIVYTVVNHPYETLLGSSNLLVGVLTYYISRLVQKKRTAARHIGKDSDNSILFNSTSIQDHE